MALEVVGGGYHDDDRDDDDDELFAVDGGSTEGITEKTEHDLADDVTDVSRSLKNTTIKTPVNVLGALGVLRIEDRERRRVREKTRRSGRAESWSVASASATYVGDENDGVDHVDDEEVVRIHEEAYTSYGEKLDLAPGYAKKSTLLLLKHGEGARSRCLVGVERGTGEDHRVRRKLGRWWGRDDLGKRRCGGDVLNRQTRKR